MKPGSIWFAFACMTLVGSLANAATSAHTATPAPESKSAAPLLPAEVASDCPAAELPFLNPSSTEKAGGPCGPCSETVCQGSTVDSICAFKNGRFYTCEAVLGERCSGTLTFNCSCWYGPLP